MTFLQIMLCEQLWRNPNKGIRPTYVNTKGEYKPQDGDQLLRYIARFALARINKENLVRFNEINQTIEKGGFCPPSGARQEKENLTKQIILMKSGLVQFSQSCKHEGAFRIVSGGSLLNS